MYRDPDQDMEQNGLEIPDDALESDPITDTDADANEDAVFELGADGAYHPVEPVGEEDDDA